MDSCTHLDPDTRQRLIAHVRRWIAERNDLAARIEDINQDVAHALRLLRMEEGAIGEEALGVASPEEAETGGDGSDSGARLPDGQEPIRLVETVREIVADHPDWSYEQVREHLDASGFAYDRKPGSNRVWLAYAQATGKNKIGRPKKNDAGEH